MGSTNPVKIRAVSQAFRRTFGKCEVWGIEVSSGVADMPMSFDESVKGAIKRSRAALKKLKTDFGVGLEGGFEKTKYGTFLSGCVAVVDKTGRVGLGNSTRILMPRLVVKKVRKGQELGEVIDEITGGKNSKQQEGATGFFTKGIIPRTKGFETATILALARFLRKELY